MSLNTEEIARLLEVTKQPVTQGMKRCNDCGELKSLEKFYIKRKGRKIYRQSVCKSCKSSSQRKRLYNLSNEEYETLLEKQNRLCAICKSEEQLHIDHNHETGNVRGLLCGNCNRKLGWYEKNFEGIINYLVDVL